MNKPKKSTLRELVRWVYEANGARVREISGRGILPGSRLKVAIGSDERVVIVRTSLDRQVSFNRRADGRLAAIPEADEVAVVVPSNEEAGVVEVLSFDRDTILSVFDVAAAAQRERYPTLPLKAPVFVRLDRPPGKAGENALSLAARAQWRKKIPLSFVPTTKSLVSETMTEFRERVLREFAELQGLPTGDVAVEFRILSRPWIPRDEN